VANYILDLDDIAEGIFHFLEGISDDGESHKCMVKDCYCAEEAAIIISKKLVPFFVKKLEPTRCSWHGRGARKRY
jgi:hypothetical protein